MFDWTVDCTGCLERDGEKERSTLRVVPLQYLYLAHDAYVSKAGMLANTVSSQRRACDSACGFAPAQWLPLA